MENLNNDKNKNFFKPQVVLITGANEGLGYSLAKKFVIDGYNVVGTYRNEKKLENIKVLPIKCDIRSETDIKNAIFQIKKSFRRIDILVNNAGIRIESSVKDMTSKMWADVINTNLTGTFLMTKYAMPLLRKSDSPIIINVSSIRGLYGGKNLSAYSASKFGIIGFSQSLAEELKNDGIKVYSICPAAMDTNMIRNVKHGIPKEKLIQLGEIANIIYKIATNPEEPTGETIIILGKQKEILEEIEKSKQYKIIQWN